MERSSFWYLKQFLDAIDNDDLTYEEKCKATYCLCYYGIKGLFPPEANGMDKMYAKSNEKLFEGQDEYKKKKTEEGSNGGSKGASVTDEQIREAYAALFYELGRYPREQEVIEKTGANVQRFSSRKVWNEDKNKWIEMYRDVYGIQKTDTYTKDIQNPYKDIHTHTYTDF